MAKAATPNIDRSDIATLAGLPLMGLASWLLPQRAWSSIARTCRPFYGKTVPGGSERAVVETISRYLGSEHADKIRAWLVEEDIADLLGLLRSYRPGGWRPTITIEGLARVEAGLAAGHGVVVWVGHFAHADLIAKMGCYQAGYPLHHLSHRRHGFSATRFGMAVLNPVKTSVENRYLAERVLLAPDSAKAALERLRQCLVENKVVSVSARRTAQNPVSAPFLTGRIEFGPGAPYLAVKTGAALIPLFAVRTEPGRFVVRFEAPLSAAPGLGRRDAIRDLTFQYAERTAAAVKECADQWLGWTTL